VTRAVRAAELAFDKAAKGPPLYPDDPHHFHVANNIMCDCVDPDAAVAFILGSGRVPEKAVLKPLLTAINLYNSSSRVALLVPFCGRLAFIPLNDAITEEIAFSRHLMQTSTEPEDSWDGCRRLGFLQDAFKIVVDELALRTSKKAEDCRVTRCQAVLAKYLSAET
jgi:hypothetical protein